MADTQGMAATKGIRLNTALRSRFEAFCRSHLLDERAVIEAWLLRFLEATDHERQQVAEAYAKWIANHSGTQVAKPKRKAASGDE